MRCSFSGIWQGSVRPRPSLPPTHGLVFVVLLAVRMEVVLKLQSSIDSCGLQPRSALDDADAAHNQGTPTPTRFGILSRPRQRPTPQQIAGTATQEPRAAPNSVCWDIRSSGTLSS